MADTMPDKHRVTTVIVLAVVCLAIYANTLNNEFVWDDPPLITENPHIRDSGNIPLFFTPFYWNRLHPFAGQYRPLRIASLRMDYSLWGLNPAGYRLTNLLLHAIDVVLVFMVVCLLSEAANSRPGGENITTRGLMSLPFMTALFFAAHPVHTESINLVKNRSDLMALAFFLLSFFLFVKHLYATGRVTRRILIFTAWFCFIPAVLSKETALILPGILVLFAVCFLPRAQWKGILVRISPYAVLIGVYLWFRHAFIRPVELSAADVRTLLPGDVIHHVLAVLKTLGIYFKILAVPYPLNADHLFVIPDSPLEPAVLLSLSVLVLAGGLAVRAYKRSPLIPFAIGWIFLTLLPAANIVYLESRPIAEQRLYIPSLGFCLLLGYGIHFWARHRSGRTVSQRSVAAGGLLAIVVAGLYTGITVRRNMDWRDEVTFFRQTLNANPDSVRMNYNLGNALSKAGRYAEAVPYYRRALQYYPDYPEAYNNLGFVFFKTGQYEKAIAQYRKVLALKPNDEDAHFNLGLTFYKTARYSAAVEQFQAVLRLQPGHVDALNYLGRTFYDMGRRDDAADVFQKTLRLAPSDAKANLNMAEAYFDGGQFEEALIYYTQVRRLQPDYPEVNYKMGICFLELNRVEKAGLYFLRELAKNPDHIGACKHLGRLLMQQGDIGKAAVLFQRALRIAPDDIAACYNLGVAKMAGHNYEEAVSLFSRVLDMDANHQKARRDRQFCLKMMRGTADSPDRVDRP